MSKKSSCLTALLIIFFIGCGGPSRVHAPKMDASAAGAAAMEQYDTNQDGKIAGDELNACPALRTAIQRVDINGNQGVSADEITARIEKWQESKLGLTSVRCIITFRGRPLPNAKIVFEPEAFLGENIASGEGTTGRTGIASIKQPKNKFPGMPLGFYKIKVTSDHMQIPAIYNENTLLGIEIASDNPDMGSGFQFNLE
jgi:hypothetical protein